MKFLKVVISLKNKFFHKKSMFVVIALMLFSIQTTHCWNLPITNKTKFKSTVTVSYSTAFCKSDTIVIEPGKTGIIDAKNCDVKEISGFVTTPRKGRVNIHVEKLGFFNKTAFFSLEIVTKTHQVKFSSTNKGNTEEVTKEFEFRFTN